MIRNAVQMHQYYRALYASLFC